MVEEVRPTFPRLLLAMTLGGIAGMALGGGALALTTPPLICFQNPDSGLVELVCDLLSSSAPQNILPFLLVILFGLAMGGAELVTQTVRVSSPLRWLLHSAGGGLLGGLFALLEGFVLIQVFQFLERAIQSGWVYILGGWLLSAGVAGMFGVGLAIAQLPLFERNKADPLSAWVTNSGYSGALLGLVAWFVVFTLLGSGGTD